MTFGELKIGQSFDFIRDGYHYNSFYKRCTKTTERQYRDDDGTEYRVGSVKCEVYHVDILNQSV